MSAVRFLRAFFTRSALDSSGGGALEEGGTYGGMGVGCVAFTCASRFSRDSTLTPCTWLHSTNDWLAECSMQTWDGLCSPGQLSRLARTFPDTTPNERSQSWPSMESPVKDTVLPRRASSVWQHLALRTGVFRGMYHSRGVADVGQGEQHSVQRAGTPALCPLRAEAGGRVLGEGQVLQHTAQHQASWPSNYQHTCTLCRSCNNLPRGSGAAAYHQECQIGNDSTKDIASFQGPTLQWVSLDCASGAAGTLQRDVRALVCEK